MKYTFTYTVESNSLTAVGAGMAWASTDEADSALKSHKVPIVVGGLPFHDHEPALLFAPQQHWFTHGKPSFVTDAAKATSPLSLISQEFSPSPERHFERVRHVIERIDAGDFDKVVLSRAVRLIFDAPVDPLRMLRNYLRNSSGYLLDLGAADTRYTGQFFVGSSPEVLVSKRGAHITTHPLAGTAARHADPVKDQAQAQELSLSAKNLEEHAYVIADIREKLQPLCSELHIPHRPSLTSTAYAWHLGTPIRATLRDESLTALDLAKILHPTPAVSGYPQAPAKAFLREHEPARGLYAGAVGWADAHGNGDWRVAIRSATVHNNTVTAHVGGGIVADSVAHEELAETTTKLKAVLAALDLPC